MVELFLLMAFAAFACGVLLTIIPPAMLNGLIAVIAPIALILCVVGLIWYYKSSSQRLAVLKINTQKWQDAEDRRKDTSKMLHYADAIDDLYICQEAERFVHLHKAFEQSSQRMRSIQIVKVDHVRRTLLKILARTHESKGLVSDQTRAELQSALHSGSRLIQQVIDGNLADNENDISSSLAALSTQLDRMVKKHHA